MLLSAALLAIAAVACAAAPAASWLIVGRFIGGLGVGLASVVSPLYISEVAPPKYRGRLVSLFQLTITIGIVAAMLVNADRKSVGCGKRVYERLEFGGRRYIKKKKKIKQ